jgi:hypothetical protein
VPIEIKGNLRSTTFVACACEKQIEEKNFTRSQATANVHYHESGSSALWWWNRITIHLRPSYVDSCQTLPFSGVPGISSCLSTPHTSPNISPWECIACPVLHALSSYPPRPDPISRLARQCICRRNSKNHAAQHSNRGPLPHKTDSNSLRRQGQLKSLIFPVE